MKCPYCNTKVKMIQLLFTKGKIKCSNCNEDFYISKVKLYMTSLLTLIFLYGITMLKINFDINKAVYIGSIIIFAFIMIVYIINIKPEK
ncbi:hypothetical protein [Clostridium saccharoperbutylacetonicum]|uniref:hypothetical protein n=1 Tax=Clostridium saccharoperbutylacetonicum TaxID=36745 RepID=UPI0039E812D6